MSSQTKTGGSYSGSGWDYQNRYNTASGVSTTNTLTKYNLGFSIPAGATIDGIKIVLMKYKSYSPMVIKDKTVELTKSGSSNKAQTYSNWQPQSAYMSTTTYGGTTDLWGTTWSYSDINNSSFGFKIDANKTDLNGGRYIQVDASAAITVYYTLALVAPTVTTQSVSGIEENDAVGNGNITDDGGATATRGMCWNTTGTPTISDTTATNGTGEGAYTVAIPDIYSGITYYARAYATNSVGTSYGTTVSFDTLTHVTIIWWRS